MPVKEKPGKTEEIPDAQVYVLQGDNEFAINGIIAELAQRFASGGFSDMNFVRLDGDSVSRSEIVNHVNTLPLGGDNRLIILDSVQEFLRAKEDVSWLETLINGMPDSVILAMVIHDALEYKKGKKDWHAVNAEHPLRKVIKRMDTKAVWLEKLLPSLRDMPKWIADQARAEGVEMEGRAAAELANLVGNDLFQVRSEILKAASYAGRGQVVTREIIRLLCSQSREEDIFAMLDAAGQRNPAKALGLLNRLMSDQPVQQIFSMVVRQFRLLIMVKEIVQAGGGINEVVSGCNTPQFVARKLLDQARRFSMDELESIYRRLDRMDEDSKTGSGTMEVMLEGLLADLSH